MSPTRLVSANGDVLEIGGHGGTARPIDSYGSVDTYARTTPARPTVEQLRELTYPDAFNSQLGTIVFKRDALTVTLHGRLYTLRTGYCRAWRANE